MKAPAFQFYAADFLADKNVAVMSAAEVGAYILLISYCWREGSLPDDTEELAALARIPAEHFEKSWDKRLKRCFEQKGGTWIHPRLEAERAKQADNREKKKMAAQKRHYPDLPPSPNPPPAMQTHNTSNADAEQTECPSSSISSASSPSGEIKSKVGSVAGANAPDTPEAFTVLGYLQYLARQPAFDHIDPVVEESKIKVWRNRPANQKRRITQRFLETWVGRIERPLTSQNGAAEKPPPDERPELTPEQIQERINEFVEMMREGHTIESIGERFAAIFRRSQWGQIRSAALAQYATPRRDPPEPASEAPPPSGQVVEFATRTAR